MARTILFSKKLLKFPELIQGILVGRLMFQNNEPKEVIALRKKAFFDLGIDLKNVVLQRQEHGNKVRIVGEKDKQAGVFNPRTYLRGTDAMITDKPNIFLVVHTADCVPLSFYDPKKKIVGMAHAGWKGTVKRIGQKTVLKMKEVFGCEPKDIIAYIGPSIGPCCYQIKMNNEPFTIQKIESFKKAFSDCLYKNRGGKTSAVFFDLWKANKKQLILAGILEKNIEESKICTVCSKLNLPSHFREKEKRTRSILSVIGKK